MTVTTAPGGADILKSFHAARNRSVPLIVLRTNDPAATIKTLSEASLTGKPVLRWEAVNGLTPLTAEGQVALAGILKGADPSATISPIEALSMLKNAPTHTCVFLQNAHKVWSDSQTIQGIWNLRDNFKANYRTLVLLTPDEAPIPSEIAGDVITFVEPLPNREQLAGVVQDIYTSVGQQGDDATIARAVEALAGVRSAFTAEQVTALCIGKSGLDINAMWEQKRQLINDTPGLTYMDPKLKFSDLGGVDALKQFFTDLFTGEGRPSVLVFLDEINDMFGGVGGDSSGVSTAMHGKFLTHITRTDAEGALFMGHPGCGKSAIVEAAAQEFNVPLVALDFGDAKDKHVGESEARIAHMLKTIDAISFGKAFYVGTCNSVENLSPQLMRRFPFRFFFDLPTVDEKKTIWPVYAKGLKPEQLKARPDDTNWTGAEIRECCKIARQFKLTLKQAAERYIVPIADSAPEAIDKRRREAANRYLSANYTGKFQLQHYDVPAVETIPAGVVRAMAGMRES